jgi:hypothetical protein
MDVENVILTKEEYESLLEDSLFLEALQSAGVDNWEGYSYACEIFREDKERAENE